MSVDPIINETQINIVLDTNIQGEQPFSFTKSVLYNKLLQDMNGYSDYPYFSSAIEYPETILKNLDYINQVAFFFKKDDFLRILKETTQYKTLAEKIKKNEIEKTELLRRKMKGESVIIDISNIVFKMDESEKNRNIKNNIMLMLTLIFPTTYPTYNNIINSYDSIFGGIMSTSSFSGIIPFLLSITLGMKSTKQKYSYIKSQSKGICTVTQIIWLNDLYNHPEYKKIVAEYIKFQEWKIIETVKKKKELEEQLKKFKINILPGLKKLENKLNLITDIVTRFKQTYYGNNDKNYLQEYQEIKFLLSDITSKNIFQSTDIILLVKFKRSFNILKDRIGRELQDLRQDFNSEKTIKEIEDLEMNNEIINIYLERQELEIEKNREKDMYSFRLTTEEQEIENLKNRIKRDWKDYSKYNEFIKLIQSFIRPNSESTNSSLQNLIEKFIKGEDTTRDFEKLLAQNDDKSPNIETGIIIKQSNPIKNTIYVRMDVIAGEITDENKSSINCIFNGEYLGNELKRLIKPGKRSFELDPNRFFFDLNTKKGNEVIKTDTKGGKKTRKNRSKK